MLSVAIVQVSAQLLSNERSPQPRASSVAGLANTPARYTRHLNLLELQTKVRDDFTITEKAPTTRNQEKALVVLGPFPG